MHRPPGPIGTRGPGVCGELGRRRFAAGENLGADGIHRTAVGGFAALRMWRAPCGCFRRAFQFLPVFQMKGMTSGHVCKGYHRNGKSYCSSHRIHEEVLDAAVQEFAQTMRIRMAEGQKNLKQKQKMWALRKPILDAHIFALQGKIKGLEQEIDKITMEKLLTIK